MYVHINLETEEAAFVAWYSLLCIDNILDVHCSLLPHANCTLMMCHCMLQFMTGCQASSIVYLPYHLSLLNVIGLIYITDYLGREVV